MDVRASSPYVTARSNFPDLIGRRGFSLRIPRVSFLASNSRQAGEDGSLMNQTQGTGTFLFRVGLVSGFKEQRAYSRIALQKRQDPLLFYLSRLFNHTLSLSMGGKCFVLGCFNSAMTWAVFLRGSEPIPTVVSGQCKAIAPSPAGLLDVSATTSVFSSWPAQLWNAT